MFATRIHLGFSVTHIRILLPAGKGSRSSWKTDLLKLFNQCATLPLILPFHCCAETNGSLERKINFKKVASQLINRLKRIAKLQKDSFKKYFLVKTRLKPTDSRQVEKRNGTYFKTS